VPIPRRPDEFDSDDATRARMARIARRDTRPELELRRALHARGRRFFVDRPVPDLPRCRPDLLFPRLRVAVFVDGCFWHLCDEHAQLPRANATYWRRKLLDNRRRDVATTARLEASGWRVVRVWEHEPLGVAVDAVERALDAVSVRVGPGPRGRGPRRGPSPPRHDS